MVWKSYATPVRFEGLVVGAFDDNETLNTTDGTTNTNFNNTPSVSGNRKAALMKIVVKDPSPLVSGTERALKADDPTSEL